MSEKFSVCAVFGETRRWRSAVIYAGKLAVLLNADALHIYLPGAGMRNAATADGEEMRLIQREKVARMVASWQAAPVVVHDDLELDTAHPRDLPPNAIVVSSTLAGKRTDLMVLDPFEETNVVRSGGCILVPFGDGDSGSISASVAVELARVLNMEIIFYHTTWIADGVQSDKPFDHMCARALLQRQRLIEMAQSAGVPHSIVLDTADDVVFGVMQCAMIGNVQVDGSEPTEMNPVSLIVMAHGINTYIGCYAEKALKISPTPILVVSAASLDGGCHV